MITTVVGVGLCVALAYAIIFVGRRDKRLPPGPPTLPIIGNLHQVPTKRTHLQQVSWRNYFSSPKLTATRFTKWAREYGGIYSLKFGPATSIVITSPRLVKQLIDKKSNIYSHRSPSYVGYNLISDGDHLLLMQYSDHWRKCRKLVHQYFMESMVNKNYIPLIEGEAVQMVNDMIQDPGHHMLHPKRFSNSIIMSLVYGTRTPNIRSVHMEKLYALMENWSKVMEPGNTPPVDIFPFLKYVPETLMGNWKTRGKNVGDEMNALYDKWLNNVITRRETTGSKDCFLDRLLDQRDSGKVEMSNHAIYFLCGTLMEGGSDTTSSIIIAFIHALLKWPEILKKAQKEVDDVVGEERSPKWSDYEKLPYIAACVKETMRWRPVVPLGFPHVLGEDDEVDGMHLPRGSQVFINAFGMQHDPDRFEKPDEFNPDHYLGVTELASELANGDWEKRDHYGYGSGRRICPGIHVAERNLFLAMSKLVWALNIERGRDESGQVIDPDVSSEKAYSAGFLVCADEYPCNITVRSAARMETLQAELTGATSIFSQFATP